MALSQKIQYIHIEQTGQKNRTVDQIRTEKNRREQKGNEIKGKEMKRNERNNKTIQKIM